MLQRDPVTNFNKTFSILKTIKMRVWTLIVNSNVSSLQIMAMYEYKFFSKVILVRYNQCLPWFIWYILGVKWVQNICEVILYVFIECRNILHWIYKGKLMVWYLGLITMHVCKICQKCRSNVLKSIRKSKIHIFI